MNETRLKRVIKKLKQMSKNKTEYTGWAISIPLYIPVTPSPSKIKSMTSSVRIRRLAKIAPVVILLTSEVPFDSILENIIQILNNKVPARA